MTSYVFSKPKEETPKKDKGDAKAEAPASKQKPNDKRYKITDWASI
ncbi:MAG: hypothetical protein SWN98_07650 [Pseudomonadota bacterium]|jgi:hypothetical protein|nr:hypothetical protein [Actibacterium sp.]MDY6859199.1 hypothetical protein [Pseudomonadota bacterium]|tara:strand:- start:132 stop:269 length:138 start_codon:yes stop_codon:yes gene_type:complete